MAATDAVRSQTGFYCSTSGTYFADLQSLSEHYKSDFHRYNLKRKVAGLPPVTKDWFEARKAQLSSAAAGATAAPVQRTWIDPLTKKKFNTENTYLAFVRSKKYAELVRKSGQPPPEPIILTRQAAAENGQPQQDATSAGAANGAAPAPSAKVAAPGFKVVAPSGGLPGKKAELLMLMLVVMGAVDAVMADVAGAESDGEDESDDESGWETASDEEMAELADMATAGAGGKKGTHMAEASRRRGGGGGEEEEWPEWDVCRSLFDNHMSESFQANLEYMFKKFGFYLPDSQYLVDPEGLLRYLGAKLQVGGVPLYVRGDDNNARQFRNLHAVQRHMVDRCQCKMVYDDNEEEYEEFYDYDVGQQDADGAAATTSDSAGAVVLAGAVPGTSAVAVAGYELVVGGGGEDGEGFSGGKVLGHREFARLYRQRHRPEDDRRSVLVNTVLARYRALGAPTSTDSVRDRKAKEEATASHRHQLASQLKMSMIKNNLKKLPKNCEY
ncbi:hypothetical protein VOLCADRAFT_96796 [Volvox carteri f. nagariensis]|uniref:ZN622/Rei1/Reh1 zinc finger C2H2-type domain-containing protein n=1 Tax=Volvox carteri f. nagariensis TaxID=3068 RepID=D8UB30_VOLCA|nr:uncharacterized protein VOLCADRAFT_96796 [Volvox carteri f. nagariensis]EFJ43099.1 hypothetical protein VOLCADRAFT_96796 [Volvox carteri f. nagariensis]|eukprot:XP_002955898.1 hypothetical protein VOLCADRAFT_96796 [Volvox carteri f. nagariensis]